MAFLTTAVTVGFLLKAALASPLWLNTTQATTSRSVVAPASSIPTITEVTTAFTTYCPYPTTFTYNDQTYTVTEATTLTITDCPGNECTPPAPGKSFYRTEDVTTFTTYCPYPTTFTYNDQTYTVTEATTLIVTGCVENHCPTFIPEKPAASKSPSTPGKPSAPESPSTPEKPSAPNESSVPRESSAAAPSKPATGTTPEDTVLPVISSGCGTSPAALLAAIIVVALL
ncbi:hypothetical protein FGADI_11469 [Fusarium gaditjirri]|uniref:Cell wall protein SED1 n=1 Tax=Fusarium gaditjirri TaxID=282569 RepID=A0A8H4WQG6_9HYPO|nr:hypothetical protein FGADI_11469 [Fusarium gaditjirri]